MKTEVAITSATPSPSLAAVLAFLAAHDSTTHNVDNLKVVIGSRALVIKMALHFVAYEDDADECWSENLPRDEVVEITHKFFAGANEWLARRQWTGRGKPK